MCRALAVLVLAGLTGLVWPDPAEADMCRPLEMRLMQIQGGGGGRAAELAELRELMTLHGCSGARAPAPTQRQAAPATREQPVARARTFRTLCVRSCDGYYFPISFSTTREHFEDDDAVCRQRCPGAEAQLFYHGVRSEGPEDMLSLAGTEYSTLENAFRYRSALDESCRCEAQSTPDLEAGLDPLDYASLPETVPATGEDPETLLNRRGGLRGPGYRNPPVALPSEETREPVRVILPGWTEDAAEALLTQVPS